MASHKPIIYQVLPRLLGNQNQRRKKNGTMEENGVGKFADINYGVLKQLKRMGVSHVWYTGILRHATQTDYSAFGIPRQHAGVVKGRAGSPYAVTDYYDIDPDLAVNVPERMQEWKALLERTHEEGLKVVIDFIPNHVAREYHSICKPQGVRDLGEDDDPQKHFSIENNFYYCWGQPFQPQFPVCDYREDIARATGNDQFSASPGVNDWYETVKLNYGIDYCDAGGRSNHFEPHPDTWNKMLHILLFWAAQGIDAFRCDMAEMVPVEFWQWAIGQVKAQYPELLFIGEVYNPHQYRDFIAAGFDYLYDKVGLYDTLFDMLHSDGWASEITRQWQSTADILPHMLYFLENHDELRIASEFFAGDAKRAIPALMVSAWLHQGALMIYEGQEFGCQGMDQEGFSGRDGRTTIFDYWCVEALRKGFFSRKELSDEELQLEQQYRLIGTITAKERAISKGEMFDLMYANTHLHHHQFAFLRKYKTDLLLCVVNFADEPVDIDLHIPQHAFDYLQITTGEHTAKNLLTGEQSSLLLHPENPLRLHINKHNGILLKLKRIS